MKSRRLFTMLALCSMLLAAQAQVREMMGGVQISHISSSYGADNIYGSLGVGARFHYELLNQLLVAPKANFYFGESGDTWWSADLAVDFHYNFVAAIDFYIYPIVGVCMSHWNQGEYFPSQNSLGVNVGIGAQYNITPNITLNGEYKYLIYKKRDVIDFALSVGYRF